MAIDPAVVERVHHYERRAVPKYPYWYGMKKALYESVGLPQWWPVSCHLQHGVGMWHAKQEPDFLAIQSPYPLLLVDNQAQVELCKNFDHPRLNKPVYPIGSIFARYRKHKGITQRADAKGTLAYPSHSSLLVAAQLDWESLAKTYQQLPAQYQPVTICIYFKDFLKGVHEIFLRAGFDVVMAGHMYDPLFVDTFYDILSRFKYVVSNDNGSYIYYAMEMGIPFFMHGIPAYYSVDAAEQDSYGTYYQQHHFDHYRNIYQLFTPTPAAIEAGITITPEQQAYVDDIMGTHEALASDDIRRLIQQHQTPYYLKELALAPLKLPLRWSRELKARFR